MKRKLTATTPWGVVARTTARTYTHAVVARLHNGEIHAMGWSGSRGLAAKTLKYWQTHLRHRFPDEKLESWEMEIFPVDERTAQ